MTITTADIGVLGDSTIFHNLSVPLLVENALKRKEGRLSKTGALVVETDKYTGRSPNDRFIVDTQLEHNTINWNENNIPIDSFHYGIIKEKMLAYLQGKELFVFDGYAGADPKYTQKIRVINELASQNLFCRQILICPDDGELETFIPDYNIIAAPGFKCNPNTDGVNSEAAIIINFDSREVLISGSKYAGEIKKSIFSIMNYILPRKGVLPMHCSANLGTEGKTALIFGLSGTGKTTLSADPSRKLIGDDEHGWSEEGVFNIEGGCYAKCIHLKKENEPEIYNAISFGTLLENVMVDECGNPDYDDISITENSRAAYPIEYIPNVALPSRGGHPSTIIFLTADAFGVLPPISKLDKNAAIYHFVSGYTSKISGTERGIEEPMLTFSMLFGAPFFPRDVAEYANMLGEKLDKVGAEVFLVNTGWCGGLAGNVPRIKLEYTRAMVSAAIEGKLRHVEYHRDPIFNVFIPKSCTSVPDEILDPKNSWKDLKEYTKVAQNLAKKFSDNIKNNYSNLPKNIVDAGPVCK